MSLSKARIHGEYEQFQGILDEILKKDNPAACIPWSSDDRPTWAFCPFRILDLGAANGRFTASTLRRLKSWDCLDQLQHLHLIEQEIGSPGSDDSAAIAEISHRCRQALAGSQGQNAAILVSKGSFEVSLRGNGKSAGLALDGAQLCAADLIIASHVTYYYPAGGRALLEGIASMLRSSGGLAWIVVRRRNCPIYRERARYLQSTGKASDEAYAEDLQQAICSTHSGLDLVDARDQSFLGNSTAPQLRRAAASLLMWRKSMDALTNEERELVDSVLGTVEPIFVERHLIVRSAR